MASEQVQQIIQQMGTAIGANCGLGGTLKFDFGDSGKIYLDGVAGKVSNEDGAADTTIKVKLEDFVDMAGGKLDPTAAFMQGKLRVEGDMGVAMQLQGVMAKLRG